MMKYVVCFMNYNGADMEDIKAEFLNRKDAEEYAEELNEDPSLAYDEEYIVIEDEFDDDIGMGCIGCEKCPHAETCGEEGRYWGCGVWEDSMGEDL